MNAVLAVLLAVPASAQQTVYDSVFDQLRGLEPVSNAVADVKDVVVRRDAMELRLESGTAYLLTPLSGRTIGIAFVGGGRLIFEPPMIVEQYNLKRVLGDSSVSGPITAAVFIFTDSTAVELQRRLSFGPGTAERVGDAADAVHAALDYLVDGRTHSATEALMTALLNKTTTGYFAAYVKRARGESVLIEFDPTQAEEVSLYRRGKMVGQRTETICQFQRAQDLADNVSPADERPEPLDVSAYDIEATIEGSYKFSARATVRLSGRAEPQRWALLWLYEELEVDSVTSGGRALQFYRRDRAAPLWVQFRQPLARGDSIDVRIVYHGSLIAMGSVLEDVVPREYLREVAPILDGWAYLKSELLWYPRYSDQRTPMRLTFHTPRDLRFATVGRLVRADTAGKTVTTQWASEIPINLASFNIGRFDEFEIRDPRIPPVTVHVNTEAHNIIARLIVHSRRGAEHVGSDIANSLSFFTQMYGPPPFQHFYATEIPYYHGISLPGLIKLSWTTYLSFSTRGNDESFRAHEMAHQWWYHGVEPASYRDAWLSEGFAEFSGLWYMQIVLQDNNKYLKKLRDSRQEIRRERNKASAIGLGGRAAENRRGNYGLITYEKGAWILHMLRNMMLDTRTMKEDRFQAMMRDYYLTYRGKRATTLDFQRIVEKHVGQPMDWFFNQWVYGTAVPTYTFSWNAETDSTGKPAVRLRVRQSDVPESFAMYVPLLIIFDDGGQAIIRLLVRGATTETTVKLPAAPRQITLNPLESVLAEVRTEPWEN